MQPTPGVRRSPGTYFSRAQGGNEWLVGCVIGGVALAAAITMIVVYKVKYDKQRARHAHAAEVQRLMHDPYTKTKGVC